MSLDALTRIMSPRQIMSIADSSKRMISLWVGAVSAGKTIASLFAFLIALRAVGPVGSVVIIGRTMKTIERNVIEPLQNQTLFGPIARSMVHTRGSDSAIILGRRVELIGANNIAAEERIRGGTFALVYVDEATLLPKEFWNMLVTRLRVAGARLIATTNPASRNHWLRKEWMLRADDVDMIAFHLTMYDNPSLTQEYIARMERTYTGVFYDRFILGLWTTAEGAIYPDWDTDNVISWADVPPLQSVIGVGLDYGTTNPTVALMLGVTAEKEARVNVPGGFVAAPRLVLLDEWVDDPKVTKRNHAPSEHAAMYRTWLKTPHVPAGVQYFAPRRHIVDPAAKAFREELLRPIGPEPGITTTAADNAVAEGIGNVSNLIGRNLLLATDRCERWLDEVSEYRWDADAAEDGEDKPVKDNDHAMDAGRYVVRTTRSLWLPAFRQAYGMAA